MYSSIRKGATFDILHTVLRIPSTIKIVYRKAPFLLKFQLIDYLLQIPAVHAVWREILDKFEGTLIFLDELLELGIAN
jgi:hypothetical protein